MSRRWITAAWYGVLHGEHALIPTSDYYFTASMRGLIAGWGDLGSSAPVRRVGPYTFRAGGRAVILRYVTPWELNRLRRKRPDVLYYVIDDLIRDKAALCALPRDYAARLARFSQGPLNAILDLDPVVLAPTEAVLSQFPQHRTGPLPPCATVAPSESMTHFQDFRRAPRLVFLGTRAHADDFDFLRPAFEHLAKKYPEIRLTSFLGAATPAAIARLPISDGRRPLAWPSFKRMLARERFHIALAPRRDTPFNRARSRTKILEHAAVGAAGIYSRSSTFETTIVHGENGLLIGDDWRDWAGAVDRLINEHIVAEAIARAGVETALEIGNPAVQRRFWRVALALEDQVGGR